MNKEDKEFEEKQKEIDELLKKHKKKINLTNNEEEINNFFNRM